MQQFERYYEYIAPVSVTDKEKLLDDFKHFLDNPNTGFFVVRWAGDDTIENTQSLQEFVETIR